ncbi:unnamed protein product [Caenorhabditis bovis]|uniref:SET domain-containing protein n=1 Tax=Caenorhabditis bovis TaxID=2654633 RepID=A0A8S1E9D0_9PELO|nr:unnamed protein product [Caenorhabditis bovis]
MPHNALLKILAQSTMESEIDVTTSLDWRSIDLSEQAKKLFLQKKIKRGNNSSAEEGNRPKRVAFTAPFVRYRDIEEIEYGEVGMIYNERNTEPLNNLAKSEDEYDYDSPDDENDLRSDLTLDKESRVQRRVVSCDEAIRGEKYGSLYITHDIPGIPNQKFNKNDLSTYGYDDRDWNVQAIYMTRIEKQRLVLYEGWAVDTASILSEKELKVTAKRRLAECNYRHKMYDLLKKKMNLTDAELPTAIRMSIEPLNKFWIYEDVTFFHNLKHQQKNWAPIYYVYTTHLEKCSFPSFEYVVDNYYKNVNIRMEDYHHINYVKKIYTWDEEMEKTIQILRKRLEARCPSLRCRCADFATKIFDKGVECGLTLRRLNYDKNGRLNLQDMNREGTSFALECGIQCGCPPDCPTKAMQRGQKYPLFVVYEKNVEGFGVRAGHAFKKGEFITEYTGEVMKVFEGKNISHVSYQMRTIGITNAIIDASTRGSVSRFVNHSCDPNAVFIEVAVPESDSDLIKPRVGIYAIKDISVGEEISTSYYSEDELENAQNGKKIKCNCNTSKCLGWLPNKY